MTDSDERTAIATDLPWRWRSAGPLLQQPVSRYHEDWIALKDPSVVRHDGRWHVFCTVRGRRRSHDIVHAAFADWAEAADAQWRSLGCHWRYAAPQVFWFRPHGCWYLLCQAQHEDWDPVRQVAVATNPDIGDPTGWSPLRPLEKPLAGGKVGLDFWVICDQERAHLFWTSNDGCLWRSETGLDRFPFGWGEPELALQGDFFEASHTYAWSDGGGYLTIIEAQNPEDRRYYQAYGADRLDGPWQPLASSEARPFASFANHEQPGGRWTDGVSHGELLRADSDERMLLDREQLRFLVQGVRHHDRVGKDYGDIPWQLGLLEQTETGAVG